MTKRLRGREELIWRSRKIDLDLDTLPATLNLSPHWALSAFLIVFGGIFAFAGFAAEADEGANTIMASLILVVAIGVAAYGAYLLTVRRTATFFSDRVAIRGQSLRGIERWSLPYGNYKGVLHKERRVKKGKNSYATLQMIELYHRDPAKCVPLYVAESDDMPRAKWEAYASAFNLPALEEAGGTISARAVEDLDKSVSELAEEGKLEFDYDPNAPPPYGVSLNRVTDSRGDVIVLSIRPWTGAFSRVALILAFPVVLMMIVIWLTVPDLAFAQAGLAVGAFGIAAFLALLAVRLFAQRLEITRDAIEVSNLFLPLGRVIGTPRRMTFAEIENVTVRSPARQPRQVVITGDNGTLRFGRGLSPEALEWVRGSVIAAIATA